MVSKSFLLVLSITALSLISCQEKIILTSGQLINESVVIKRDTFKINATDSLKQPVLVIEGNNLVIDFNNAVLVGSNDKALPNDYYGLAILVRNSKNITIKNAKVHGYKVGLIAENTDSISLIDCDFSYNYRQKLKSIREREDLSDWLSYHQNEKDEWLRYGMAVYLKNSHNALVKNLKVTGGQNGLMLSNSNDGLFYNNDISFNSGVGIGMYRSNRNEVVHNRLDWNIRGYSHGFYNRGQDSAGILVYEQSNQNVFAFNSATHSGDGIFLWGGQSTIDTGEGGCNENIIYGNDFSHAPTNGVEITFSTNYVVNNIIKECRYGVWAGYSHHSIIKDNIMSDSDYGVAIEYGNTNRIEGNEFSNISKVGVQLWERGIASHDLGYSQHRDVASRNYLIADNSFSEVEQPFKIEKTTGVMVENNTGLTKDLPVEWTNFKASDKENLIKESSVGYTIPEKRADGIETFLDPSHPRGREYMMINEWGPYDFRYPVIWLTNIEDDVYTFNLYGPEGHWKLADSEGIKSMSAETGSFPAIITAVKETESNEIIINLEYTGEAVTNQFGKHFSKGHVYPFSFYRYQKTLNWDLSFYEYNEKNHPLKNYKAFKALKNQKPQFSQSTTDMSFSWWRSPGGDIHPDRFATFAHTDFSMKPGKYRLQVTSDDGMKLFLDGKLLIDNWNIHVPATDEVIVELDGKHSIDIEHFEGGGFSTLAFLLEPVKD